MVMYEVIQSDSHISPSRSRESFGAFALPALIQLSCFGPFITSRAALVQENNNKLTSH